MIVREFRVNAGCEQGFERVFGPGGVWCRLLERCSDRYVDTALQFISSAGRRYEVRDFWKSHWDFEFFRATYQHDVEEFRKWLASKGLVEHESLLGTFYSGPDEDAGLVLT